MRALMLKNCIGVRAPISTHIEGLTKGRTPKKQSLMPIG